MTNFINTGRLFWIPLLAVALLVVHSPRAQAQSSSLNIYGTGTAATSAHVNISQSGSDSAYFLADSINIWSPGSITYWGEDAIGGAPLAERIISFRAAYVKGQAQLEWITVSEKGMAGFYLRRRVPPKGTYSRLTKAMVPARGDALSGSRYEHRDPDVQTGQAYDYLLEVINDTGKSDFIGPVRLSIPGKKIPDILSPARVPAAQSGLQLKAGADNVPDAEDPEGVGCAFVPGQDPAGAGLPALLLLLAAFITIRGFSSGRRGSACSRRSGEDS